MNATSIHLYIANLEAENKRLLTLVGDKNAVIERLEAEIIAIHDDCESQTGSCDTPDYECESPPRVRRVLSPSYESDSDSDSDSVHQYVPKKNDALYYALLGVAEKEEDEYKRDAFEHAANAVFGLPFKVTSGAEVSTGPRKVKGIGKRIATMIDEFLSTGTITRGHPNEKIAAALDALVSDNEHKTMAFKNAAAAVRKIKEPITSGKQLSEGPKKVKGIGKGIGKKIDEFLSTGKISN